MNNVLDGNGAGRKVEVDVELFSFDQDALRGHFSRQDFAQSDGCLRWVNDQDAAAWGDSVLRIELKVEGGLDAGLWGGGLDEGLANREGVVGSDNRACQLRVDIDVVFVSDAHLDRICRLCRRRIADVLHGHREAV